MVRKRGTEKERHWQRLVDRQAKSGLTIQAFCSRESISQPSFYAWRKKLRERRHEGTQRPKSSRRRNEAVKTGKFIPLAIGNSPGTLEIVHPRGYRVRVSGAVDHQALQQVLEVLDGRAER